MLKNKVDRYIFELLWIDSIYLTGSSSIKPLLAKWGALKKRVVSNNIIGFNADFAVYSTMLSLVLHFLCIILSHMTYYE